MIKECPETGLRYVEREMYICSECQDGEESEAPDDEQHGAFYCNYCGGGMLPKRWFQNTEPPTAAATPAAVAVASP